jgi:hypothetical protein
MVGLILVYSLLHLLIDLHTLLALVWGAVWILHVGKVSRQHCQRGFGYMQDIE